jgi:hypothetical protein
VKKGSQRTDIDIVAPGADAVYLFECKHSITPTGAHQLRDPWRDIQKAVSQLRTAMDILKMRLADYLAGWFPGTDRSVASRLVLKPCVLCSHRVFSGISIQGIPVRDHASLAQTCGDATVRLGFSEDGRQVKLKRYRLRRSADPTVADLDNYLSEQSIFFATFTPFMRPFARLDTLSNTLAVAHESYVFQMTEEEWIGRLEQLGAQRLDDEILFVGPADGPAAAAAAGESS